MTAWETFDWDNIETRVRAKSSITPDKDDVRAILKLIHGIDKVRDSAPNSCSGKCHYYCKVFFRRSPCLQAFFFCIFVVNFSITIDGLFLMHHDLEPYTFKATNFLSVDRKTWLAIILSFCIIVNFLVYVFTLFGSQACLTSKLSKWGHSFICSLYFLRMFEGFLFALSCFALALVGLDAVGLISNSSTIASIHCICESSMDGVKGYTELASKDHILSFFLDFKTLDDSLVPGFCAAMNNIRGNLSMYWYTNFMALIAQVVLTICAYQNYMVTKAVWESSMYGSEVELELQKRREELEAAKELKKKQKQEKKAAKRELRNSITEKRHPGILQKKPSNSSNCENAGSKRTPGGNSSSKGTIELAYGETGGEAFSAYDHATRTTISYVSDSDSDYNEGFEVETSNVERESSTTMTNNAFDGGEWWKE